MKMLLGALNRPATKRTYKGEKIGTYAKTPDAQYTAKVKSKDLYADLDLSKTMTAYDKDAALALSALWTA